MQVQLERGRVDVDAVRNAFELVAAQKNLVTDDEFTTSYDGGRYLSCTFNTSDHDSLWAYVSKSVYASPELGEAIVIASIPVCER